MDPGRVLETERRCSCSDGGLPGPGGRSTVPATSKRSWFSHLDEPLVRSAGATDVGRPGPRHLVIDQIAFLEVLSPECHRRALRIVAVIGTIGLFVYRRVERLDRIRGARTTRSRAARS